MRSEPVALLILALALGCAPKGGAPDPSFRRAVAAYETAAAARNMHYSDARFDVVLAELRKVPVSAAEHGAAQALIADIENKRKEESEQQARVQASLRPPPPSQPGVDPPTREPLTIPLDMLASPPNTDFQAGPEEVPAAEPGESAFDRAAREAAARNAAARGQVKSQYQRETEEAQRAERDQACAKRREECQTRCVSSTSKNGSTRVQGNQVITTPPQGGYGSNEYQSCARACPSC